MGGVRACGRGALAALGVMGCAGFEAGQLSARGLHVRTEHPRSTAWFALSADAGLVWTVVPKLGLLLQAGVARPLSRPTFVLDGTQAVHGTAALTVRALFGAELYF